MDNTFTITAAYIAAIAAIVAPTITALIHSVKEYKITKMVHTIEKRLELCGKFSNAYSNCQYGPHRNGYTLTFYKTTLTLVAVCSHRSVRRSLFKLANQVLEHGASKDTDKLYERCISLLTKEF